MDCLTAPAMDINFLDELLNGNLALDVDELLCAAEADDTFISAEPVIGDSALDDFMNFIEEETMAKAKIVLQEAVPVAATEIVEAPEAMEEEVVIEGTCAPSLYSDDIWEKFSLPPEGCDLELADVDLAMDEAQVPLPLSVPLWSTANLEAAAAAMREGKSHDCMWAGSCRSNEHKRSPRRQPRQLPPPPPPPPEPVFPSTTDNSLLLSSRSTTVPAAAGLRKRAAPGGGRSILAKPANSRSLLRNGGPTVAVKAVKVEPADDGHSPDSEGRSPRPETPQSLVESEDDAPVFRHTFDAIFNEGPFVETTTCEVVVGDEDTDDYDDEEITEEETDEECSQQLVHASEVTGRRPPTDEETSASRTAVSSYYNDHSYTMSKGSMRTDNLGVQTPSDSEEEIDVVSVGDKPQPQSRGAAVSLPTNPSPHDRRQLQITVASAISSATARLPSGAAATPTPATSAATQRAMPPTPPSSCDDADASPSTSVKKRQYHRGANKNAKRARHHQQQQQHHHHHHHRATQGQRGRRGGGGGGRFGGSDSEPDSCERRSLHNNMERQRRIDLRNLVENLRVLVPATEDKKRAAKVVILREAALYCAALRETGRELVDVVTTLRNRQEDLRQKVSGLRRSLAAQR